MSKRTINSLLGLLAVVLFSILYIGNPFKLLKIQGNSMCPAVLNGEVIVVNNRFEINRFDIVTFYDPQNNDLLLKRIIAMPNETIEIKEGFIFVNGRKLEDQFGIGKLYQYLVNEKDELMIYQEGFNMGRPMTENINISSIVLAEDEYFYIGDNRNSSVFGVVKKKNIIGEFLMFFHL